MKIVVDWMSGMEIPGGVDPDLWFWTHFKLLKGKEQDWWILSWLNDLLNMFVEQERRSE